MYRIPLCSSSLACWLVIGALCPPRIDARLCRRLWSVANNHVALKLPVQCFNLTAVSVCLGLESEIVVTQKCSTEPTSVLEQDTLKMA